TPWGSVEVRKGQVWGKSKRLIVHADWQNITYLEGEKLWSVRTPDFAREILLDGMIDGMNRAKPLVRYTKIFMGFVQGTLVGAPVSIASKLVVLFMWAGAHEKLVE